MKYNFIFSSRVASSRLFSHRYSTSRSLRAFALLVFADIGCWVVVWWCDCGGEAGGGGEAAGGGGLWVRRVLYFAPLNRYSWSRTNSREGTPPRIHPFTAAPST